MASETGNGRHNMSWIQTHGANAFDFEAALRGEHQAITLQDIAHSLAMQCRYTGHTAWHYSIAQHSILVSQLATRWAAQGGVERRDLRKYAAAGLMHDAAEAYVGDVSRPLKHLLRSTSDAYDRIEGAVEAMIERRFGLVVTEPMRQLVKRADVALLHWEKLALLPGAPPRARTAGAEADDDPVTIAEWSPTQARRWFLDACADAGVADE
jgi:hypothetical protein